MSKKKVFDGDKTVLDVRKAEERELSEQIHRNLELLNVMYPRSYDFQNHFAQDIFLKPNTKAFPYVMHYLFNILDAVEFKKRFYWPLDRTSENAFRTNTVQYLNYLNEKHHLGWGEIKVFLVVMPGGMKFMKLLSDLINFVVDEETKKLERCLPESLHKTELSLTSHTVKKIIKNHEIFMGKALAYKEKLESQKAIMKEQSDRIGNKLQQLCESAELSLDKVDNSFLKRFALNNYDLFDKSIVNKVNEIEKTDKCLDKLSNEVDQFYSDKNPLECNKDLLASSYECIRKNCPELNSKEILTYDKKIQLESLFAAFNCIFPALESALKQCDLTEKRIEKYEFELNEITQLEHKAVQLDGDIFKFEIAVDNVKVDAADTTTPEKPSVAPESSLKLKYVCTPTIFVQKDNPDAVKNRLPFMDDSVESSFSFANQTTILAQRAANASNTSFGGNSSKLMDPIALLRTVTKSRHRKRKQNRNTSSLSMIDSKCTESKLSFFNDNDNLSKTVIGMGDILETPCSSRRNMSYCKEVELSDRRLAIREKLIDKQNINISGDSIIFASTSRTTYATKMDLDTLNKSPLEPFVRLDTPFNISPGIPEIKVDDFSENITNFSNDMEETRIERNMQKNSSEKAKHDKALNAEDNKKDEHNISDFCLNFQKKLGTSFEKESIFNESDTILQDITL